MEAIKAVIEKFKLKELCAVLFISTALITFLPDNVINAMRLEIFRKEYQSYISIVLIVIGACYIYWLAENIYKKIKNRICGIEHRAKRYMQKAMSEDEKCLLIEKFYDDNSKQFRTTGYIELGDGRKAALEYKNIIYRSSTISKRFTEFSYNLQPYVLQLLNKNLANGNIVIERNKYKFEIR